jgi:uncharacterized protein
VTLRPLSHSDLGWVHALNQINRIALSDESEASLGGLIDRARFAFVAPPDEGFLLAFDQAPAKTSPNWDWLAARLTRFVYVDRIAVASHARGQGLARALYEALFAEAALAGARQIACEVNSDPPNPGSDAFHAALGFLPIGSQKLATNGKTVRYLVRQLA